MSIEDDQRAAYALCRNMAKTHGWWATYNAITDDGFDPTVDWISMLEKWKAKQ